MGSRLAYWALRVIGFVIGAAIAAGLEYLLLGIFKPWLQYAPLPRRSWVDHSSDNGRRRRAMGDTLCEVGYSLPVRRKR